MELPSKSPVCSLVPDAKAGMVMCVKLWQVGTRPEPPLLLPLGFPLADNISDSHANNKKKNKSSSTFFKILHMKDVVDDLHADDSSCAVIPKRCISAGVECDSVIRAFGRAEGFAAIYQPAALQPAHPHLAPLCWLNAPQGVFFFLNVFLFFSRKANNDTL